MNKSVIMNFDDGPKEITVGMEVVYGNGQGRHHFRLTETKVEKIGRKYATMENGDQFSLKDGTKKSQYISGKLFSSKAAFDFDTIKNKTIFFVEQSLRNRHLTYEEALAVASALNLKLENI